MWEISVLIIIISLVTPIEAQEVIPVFGRVTNQFQVGRDSLQITFSYTDGDSNRTVDAPTRADGSYETELHLGVGVNTPPSTPTDFQLFQNYPNLFNPSTIIPFYLGITSEVTLTVFDVTGRIVFRLARSKAYDSGHYQVIWTGVNDHGMPVGSGIYFCQIKTDREAHSIRMLLMDGGTPSPISSSNSFTPSTNHGDFDQNPIFPGKSNLIDSQDDLLATVTIRDLNPFPAHRSNFREREISITGRDSVNLQVTDHLLNSRRIQPFEITREYTLHDDQINENAGNWNQWWIHGPLQIRNNGELVAPPRSMIFMHENAEILVQNGRLRFDGESYRTRILVKPWVDDEPEYYWDKIQFDNNALSGSVLNHIEIWKATRGLYFSHCDNNFEVTNCYVRGCKERGIEIDTDEGSVTVSHCKITETYYQYPDGGAIIGFGVLLQGGNPTVQYCEFFEPDRQQNYCHIRINTSATVRFNNFASNNDAYHAYRHCVWNAGRRDDSVDGRNNWWGEANINSTQKRHRDDWMCLSDDLGTFNWNPVSNEYIDDAGIEE